MADSDEESSSAGSSDEEEPQEVFTDKPVPPGAERWVTDTDSPLETLDLTSVNVDEILLIMLSPRVG